MAEKGSKRRRTLSNKQKKEEEEVLKFMLLLRPRRNGGCIIHGGSHGPKLPRLDLQQVQLNADLTAQHRRFCFAASPTIDSSRCRSLACSKAARPSRRKSKGNHAAAVTPRDHLPRFSAPSHVLVLSSIKGRSSAAGNNSSSSQQHPLAQPIE